MKNLRQHPHPPVRLPLSWPRTSEETSGYHMELLEGYARAWQNVDAFRNSRKRRTILRQFVTLRHQRRELQSELFVLRREVAASETVRDILEAAAAESKSPIPYLEAYLSWLRAGRGRPEIKTFSKSLLKMVPEMDSSIVQDFMESAVRDYRELLDKRIRIAKHDRAVWILVAGIIRETDSHWRLLTMVPHPWDDGLRWLKTTASANDLAMAPDENRPRPLEPAQIPELRNEVARLERHLELTRQEETRLRERLNLGAEFAVEPLESCLSKGDRSKNALNFPYLLCMHRGLEMSLEFSAMTSAELGGKFDDPWCWLLRGTWGFWWVVLQSILLETGALSDDGAVQPWLPELISSLLEHPAKLARAPVPAPAVKARSQLSRRVAPLARMTLPVHRLPAPDAPASAAAFPQLLVHAAHLLARRALGEAGDDPLELSKEEMTLLREFTQEFIIPRGHDLLSGVRSTVMAAYGERETGLAAATVPAPGGEELDFGMGTDPAVAPKIHWSYVRHPGAPEQHDEDLGVMENGLELPLESFLQAEGIPPIVKPKSVMRALQYFEAMPEEIRRLLPAEMPSGERWAKLKRGGLRILIHAVEPGRAQFHLYARRDWVGPLEYR